MSGRGSIKRVLESGNHFEVHLDDGRMIWSRKQEGRYPEAKEVKQRVRDLIVLARQLGHTDKR